ncbi:MULTISPECIES: hypothetical protein [Providencia]|nr:MULTISPECIES: hypothetical protein [Providencia]ETS98885.1 hypothetical protein HMPREF1568_3152 [Providencia alcalifaciens PAL-3]EUC99347.1 hypothetical protein HMPREF1566_0519 [Providencia alcalifaciens PAL-1]
MPINEPSRFGRLSQCVKAPAWQSVDRFDTPHTREIPTPTQAEI